MDGSKSDENDKCKQALQHSIVSAMVPRALDIGMDRHPAKPCVLVIGE